jgi:hypothetical protein
MLPNKHIWNLLYGQGQGQGQGFQISETVKILYLFIDFFYNKPNKFRVLWRNLNS